MCDVGYGKTEVAVRAAFKAVMEGNKWPFLFLLPFWLNSIMRR